MRMKGEAPATAERTIRRYENRKLYDVQARRYVTLDGLAALIAAGTEVHVVDQPTGEDITNVVLAQVVLEGVKQRTASIPHQVLTRIIRLGSGKGGGFAEWIDPQEASARALREAERIVSGLVARGRLTLDEALALRQEITGTFQKLVTDAQAGIHARLRRLLDAEKDTHHPALHALQERLAAFEAQITPSTAPARRRSTRARKKS